MRRSTASRCSYTRRERITVGFTPSYFQLWLRKVSCSVAALATNCGARTNGTATTRRCIELLQRPPSAAYSRSEEHTSALQSRFDIVCRHLLEYTHTSGSRSSHTGTFTLPLHDSLPISSRNYHRLLHTLLLSALAKEGVVLGSGARDELRRAYERDRDYQEVYRAVAETTQCRVL